MENDKYKIDSNHKHFQILRGLLKGSLSWKLKHILNRYTVRFRAKWQVIAWLQPLVERDKFYERNRLNQAMVKSTRIVHKSCYGFLLSFTTRFCSSQMGVSLFLLEIKPHWCSSQQMLKIFKMALNSWQSRLATQLSLRLAWAADLQNLWSRQVTKSTLGLLWDWCFNWQ